MTKWILNHGCHKGTLTSRDNAMPEEHDTKEEAMQSYQEHRKFYRSRGYQIWYAELVSPNGDKQMLESNPYR